MKESAKDIFHKIEPNQYENKVLREARDGSSAKLLYKKYFEYTKYKAQQEKEVKLGEEKWARWREVMVKMGYEAAHMSNKKIKHEVRKLLNFHMFDHQWFTEYKNDENIHYAELQFIMDNETAPL